VLATNAGGTAVLRYGNARELTLGLEVVLADGRVWDGLRGLRKDNTGYDLKQLFVGAEGTLGVITAAVLKLYPAPRSQATAFVAVPHPQAAVQLLGVLRKRLADRLTGFELIGALPLALCRKHHPALPDPLPGHAWFVLVQVDDAAPEAPTVAVPSEASDSGNSSPCARAASCAAASVAPASMVIVALAASIARTRCMRVSDSNKARPDSSGVAAPHMLVLPPCGTTGTPCSRQAATTAATSAVEPGRTMASVRPV
jgi:FAD/FMN-containing dehydrogenase